MFNTVLIGVDGEAGGRDAVALARRLVSPGGALTLAYIHGGYPIIGRGSNNDFEAAERRRAGELLAGIADETGIERILSLGAESVGAGLHRLAEQTDADLLVIGSTRHGRLGRVVVGDDTRHALEGAPCAAAVAPAGYAEEPAPIAEIGVAYNESAESAHALAVARALAADHGAKLSAFEALDMPSYAYIGVGITAPVLSEGDVEDARARISSLGGIEAHAGLGDPSELLTTYSGSVDLLVVGSRDYGPIGRLMHGSTTHRLVRTAVCPVLVLTRAARAHELAGTDRVHRNDKSAVTA
jgi:nucleotide-binding universal stress UspA family protein